MKTYKYLAAAAIAIFVATGCKPTEKNYQSAYDKALAASQRKMEKETESVNGQRMESLNGPRIEVVNGDTLYVSTDRTTPFETTIDKEKGRTGVAVALYKMPTNARRHAETLRETYPGALVAHDGKDNYYVVVAVVKTWPEAAEAIREFKTSHPDYRYIGLPLGPMNVFIH